MANAGASGTLEEPQVEAMFDRIAGVYDLMNSLMTAGLHHRWRRRAVEAHVLKLERLLLLLFLVGCPSPTSPRCRVPCRR